MVERILEVDQRVLGHAPTRVQSFASCPLSRRVRFVPERNISANAHVYGYRPRRGRWRWHCRSHLRAAGASYRRPQSRECVGRERLITNRQSKPYCTAYRPKGTPRYSTALRGPSGWVPWGKLYYVVRCLDMFARKSLGQVNRVFPPAYGIDK